MGRSFLRGLFHPPPPTSPSTLNCSWCCGLLKECYGYMYNRSIQTQCARDCMGGTADAEIKVLCAGNPELEWVSMITALHAIGVTHICRDGSFVWHFVLFFSRNVWSEGRGTERSVLHQQESVSIGRCAWCSGRAQGSRALPQQSAHSFPSRFYRSVLVCVC